MMELVINFSDIDLADWIDYDPETEAVSLKDIFKGEILDKFVQRINYDSEVRRYIEKNIDNQLYQKIYEYKDDIAIKTIVSEIIEKKMKATGSFIFLDSYADKVESVVEDCLKKYPQKIEQAVQLSIRLQIEKCLNELYKGSAMREFIDFKKLTAHIHKVLSEEMAGEG